jgi:hypothetical protein
MSSTQSVAGQPVAAARSQADAPRRLAVGDDLLGQRLELFHRLGTRSPHPRSSRGCTRPATSHRPCRRSRRTGPCRPRRHRCRDRPRTGRRRSFRGAPSRPCRRPAASEARIDAICCHVGGKTRLREDRDVGRPSRPSASMTICCSKLSEPRPAIPKRFGMLQEDYVCQPESRAKVVPRLQLVRQPHFILDSRPLMLQRKIISQRMIGFCAFFACPAGLRWWTWIARDRPHPGLSKPL